MTCAQSGAPRIFRAELPSTNPAMVRRKFFPFVPHIGRTHETSSVLPTNCLLISCDAGFRHHASTAHQGRRSKQLAQFHLREKKFRMIDATEERAKMCRSELYVVSPASMTYNILWEDGAFGRSKESGKVWISGSSSRGLAKGSSYPVPFGPPHFMRRKAKSKLVGNPAANSASRPADERPRAAGGADWPLALAIGFGRFGRRNDGSPAARFKSIAMPMARQQRSIAHLTERECRLWIV